MNYSSSGGTIRSSERAAHTCILLKHSNSVFLRQHVITNGLFLVPLSPENRKADTHWVMSGVVTACFIRTGRETISLSWTGVVSVALRSVGSTGSPQGPRVTCFSNWHSGDEAAREGDDGNNYALTTAESWQNVRRQSKRRTISFLTWGIQK